MKFKLLIIKVFLLICVTSAKLTVDIISSTTSLDTSNNTVKQFNKTLYYNDDLITLTNTQEDLIEKPLSLYDETTTIKPFKYWTTYQKPLKYDEDAEGRQTLQKQENLNNDYQKHYPTLKFNNENFTLNKLKTSTKDVASATNASASGTHKEIIQTTVVTTKTTTATFNDNKQLKDFQMNDDEHFSNSFVGQLPQFQQQQQQQRQQFYQQQQQLQQHEQPLLPQEYHHLSDYRLLFNPERHTEFYLHTISLPEYGTTREAETVVDGDEDNDDNDSTNVAHNDVHDTIMMTNLTNPRVLNVFTDTIGAAFGVNTRPVAAIRGIRIEEIKLYNGLSLRQSRFNPFNPCRILIHGWLGGSKASMHNILVPEYLKQQQGSYNIITVDWGKGAIADYLTASYHVKPVGKVVAKFIDFLHQESGIPLEQIQVIGFSMGAHVAGIAGKYIQTGRLPVIYGLDPALPLFKYENVNERIDRSDAEYVEVIHSNAGNYGYDHPLGHVDFYINFGNNQPGCFFYECSHFRAFLIFAQSLHNEVISGRECSEELWVDMIKHKRCLSVTGLQLSMAVEGLNATMMALRRGVYYVITNSQPPFQVT